MCLMAAYETIGCYFCDARKIQTSGSCASLRYTLRRTALLGLFGGSTPPKTLCCTNLKGDLNQGKVRRVYSKTFIVPLHLRLRSRSRAAGSAEPVWLTVVSLQSRFNGASMPASPGTRRLVVAAGYRRPAGCRSDPLCHNLPLHQAQAGTFSPL